MQGILQQTKDDGRSTAPPLMSMPDSGFESAADPLESREPSSTLEKTQSHLYNHADEKSDGLEGSSLPVPSLKGATTAVSSFSSKAGLEGYTEPPGGRSEKSSNYNSGPPPVYNVYTTLMSHADTPGLEGKRFPVQAQQPAAVIHPYPYPESGRLSSSGTSPPVIPEPSTPGLDMMLAASPMNCKVMTRFVSFANSWSTLTTGQSPKDLALAGFFYLGTGDSVRCFYCGITLREWKHGDDPWEVHIVARFSCAYVKAVKGEDFILQTLISHSRNTACCLLEMHGSRHPLLHGSISRVLELFVETTTMHRQYKLHQDLANHHSGDPHFGG
ncbi:uncharacterized protein LOC112567362 [Pomacea canaliculata]|uniref:uncharacterized protein LOC112567362 n=1 Tax=Pomacea canaliculata TaxID=400727 RepID=UPI000D7281D8|nr:uncharacterized protein LOC112567362 [Pomacea canaliculata]